MTFARGCGIWVCALAFAVTAAAQDSASGAAGLVPPRVKTRDAQGNVTVRATRVDAPPRIDGVLDEAVYREVEPITDFIQQDPNEGQLATEPTLVWLLFDTRNIYIGARCRDSHPDRIVANDMRHDGKNVSANDNISIIIDTFHDRRNGYEFLLNSIGGVWDTQVTDERDANHDWNTVWVSRAHRDDEGWTIELAIPFQSLRYHGSGPQVWGINIRRNVRWKNELSYLSPVPRQYGARGILRLSQAATLVGLEAPPASLSLEVKPFGVSSLKSDRPLDGVSLKNEFDRDAGLDLKYGVTPSLTADFTYRTDFSQVEDDDQQVNLTRFNLLYPEKRDFFLEGQGLFAFGGAASTPATSATTGTPLNTPLLFFSRRIGLSGSRGVPIEAGGRLTGKAGRYTIGLLDIQTDNNPIANAAATNFGIVRVKRNIFSRSYIGVIATRRAPSTGHDGNNSVGGVDANLWFSKNLNVLGYYAGTKTDGLHGDARSYRARFDYDADLFGFQLEQQQVGRNFNPEVGFLRRAGFIENLAQIRVSRRPRTRRALRRISYEAALDYLTNRHYRLENREARLGVRGEMQSGDSWNVGYNRDFEFLPAGFDIVRGTRVPQGTYHSRTLRASYTLGTQRKLSGDFSVARGGFYGGDRTDAAYRGRIELSSRFSVEPGVSFNIVNLPGGEFTAKLVTTRGTYAFSPRMSTAVLVQYNSTTDLVSTNARFRWEYRPMSDLFVVYSDGRDTLQHGFPALMNRGFTVKLTRLFRF